MAAGAVERSEKRRGGRGRPTAVYSAAPVSGWPGRRDPVLLGRILIDAAAAGAEVDAWEAGRRWGRKRPAGTGAGASTESVREEIARHLEQTGFDPAEVPDSNAAHGETRIDLRNCAFADFLGPHQRAVCSLHAGMIEGAREVVDAHRSYGVELHPLVEPFVCAVTVRPRSSGHGADCEGS